MREIKFRAWGGGKMEYDFNPFPFTFNTHGYIIEQFTGQQDKNGVDIYEGDYDKDYEVVMWCEKRMGWALKTYDHPTKEVIHCNCYNCDGNYEMSEVTEEIEIIGNIHTTKL